ncbi:DNA polymerase domain-containing protein [Thermococcus barophilus]|uniref:DNA polymerase n=1 Tax=Thermococcus barophilus TaxID=55802 RepID=A0A0S1XDG0_THEBA|nr:DNA polymerase domain-containing protein [Thermococcus barophilus]ALM75851.1 DNA-directed DNA polymerase [Thermococcus barophilus]AMR71157.1 DNA polymerase [Thermococcus barophilus]
MILDTDYITKDGKPIIRIFKKENGEFKIELDRNFQPYIYALLESDDAIEEVKKITAKRGNKTVRVLKAEKVQKKFLGRPIEVWKLIFEHPQDVPAIREKIREHPKVIDIFEYDIPFAKRYLIDKGLIPMEGDEELKLLAFDIETFYHEGEQFGEGEIIMISYADENEAKVITWKKIDLPYVEVVSSEREMIKRFVQIIREKDPDVLITYNGDNFDLPYLIKRAQKLGLRLFISRDKENPEPKIQRMGDRFAVEIKGRIHFDLFPVVRRTINLPTYTLEAVYEAVLGKKKTKLEAAEITAIWESEEGMKELAKYSMEDAKATYELGREFFPMEAELARLIGQSVWDVSRSSTGNLVEWFLLRIAYQRNELAPNKPSDEEYQRRLRTTYLGGYVKEPERGLWENIVYLDFRCHPADTKVVVKGKGIVNISEIREGDYVLGINGWHKVLKVWEYDYDGELVNVNGLKCTPNHKLPVVTQKKRQTVIRDSYAKSMLTNKVKGRIIATHLFESIGEIEKRKSEFSEEFILKSELAGIILAEGHLLRKDIRYFDYSRRRHRVSHQYRVAITVNEDEKELIDRINYIFEKLFGCKPLIKRKKNSKALTLQCAKKSVYLEIENIMREIENLDAASVLRGFFEGDGTINTVRRTVVANQGTRNKKKIELVSKLLNKLGIRHSTYTYTDEKNGKRYTRYIIEIPWRGELVKFAILVGFISTRKKELLKQIIEQKEMYQIENSDFYRLNEIHATKEYYKGKVYDLTLDGAPYYFANGILTHNSLYPSIIITHNVSPDTLEREGCKNYDVAPIVGYKFCKDFKGFIPSILEELIETRTKIKKEMKATIDPIKRKMLDYRQKAVKLLANSLLSDQWVFVFENDHPRFLSIGELVDRMMEASPEKIKIVDGSEVFEVSNLWTISFDRNSKKARLSKIKAIIRHRYKGKAYRIKLSSGRTIKITQGHSLFTVKGSEISEITGDELKEGDVIIVPKRFKLDGREMFVILPRLFALLPSEDTEDIILTIPVKGRKNFFRGMLRALKWIFGEEEKRIRTFNRYLFHLEELGFVTIKPRGFEVINWERLEKYKRIYEILSQKAKYNGNKGEYFIRFNDLRDVIEEFPLEELAEWRIGTLNGFRMKSIVKLDKHFARFLGYYVSEGSARKQRNQTEGFSYTVRLYNENEEILKDMEHVSKVLFGDVKRGENYVEISKKVAYLIVKAMCGVGAENKKIPEPIFLAPEELRWEFLHAYFLGDGDVHPSKRLRLPTKSELLANQVVFLLNSLGISSIKLGFDSGVYRIYINEDLPFLRTGRQKNNYYSNLIPKEVLEAVFGKRFQKNMSFAKFKELVEKGELDWKKARLIEWLIEGDLALDRVESVEEFFYEGYVYDLSVEEDENFLAGFGWLYAHNSFYGYMGYPKARWYSKECAESVTAWGRTYIETTIKEIEKKFGFKVLYADSVTGDTEIIIRENGRIKFVKIKELFKRTDYSVGEKEYCMLENIEALTLDNRGRLVWRKVPYVMRHKAKKRVYRIWFTNSWYLDVTEDHSLIGYLTTRELGGKKPLRERLIEVKPEELGKSVKSLITLNGAFARSASTTEVGTKLWELIGLLVGDGNWGGNSHWANYYVGLSTGEDLAEIERKILIPLKEAGIISNYYPKGKPGDISILSKWLAKFMNKYFKENGRKRIPEFMFKLPGEYIAAFLRGLFTADGTVSVRKSRGTLEVRLTNVNKNLINDVRKLLWLVGVSNSLFRESNPNRYKGKSNGTYSFHLRIKDKHAFIKKIGFITDRKNERLKNLKEAVPKSGIRRYQFDLVQPKKIEEIKYDDYVYDIEVEETHRFFANGILVHNTDGLYATMPGADAETIKKKAKEFLKYINSKLPGLLELEYEGFYLRGFFVTKKRYAVIDEEGKITTRGLEVVRRDWSEIAKETQAKVLEAILKDGSVEKAVEIVKKVVEDLAKYKVPLEKLVIHEQITKSLDEYKATGPHVAVARRLKAKGIKVRPGMIISYIILKGDKKISDRAILLSEYDPKKHKYDPDYYIEHQVLPAVLRILEAFGYRKEDLRYQKTKQLGLGAWLNVRK